MRRHGNYKGDTDDVGGIGMTSTTDRLYERLSQQIAAAEYAIGAGQQDLVTEADLVGLPDIVRRYLRFMGTVGRPRIWSFHAKIVGRFRLRRWLGWSPAEAWQYNSGPDTARVFLMRLRVAQVLPLLGRDTYEHGHGHMLGTLFDRVTVVEGRGEEFDIGELTTYLNDAILFAPSMLLGAATSWRAVDDNSFEVSLTDAGRTVTGRVYVDGRGAPYDFSSTDRFADLPGGPVRAEWHTPVRDWTVIDGRGAPTHLEAVWHLPQGPMPYFTGELIHLAHNVPSQIRRGERTASTPASAGRSGGHIYAFWSLCEPA
jgi:hypothetical protein